MSISLRCCWCFWDVSTVRDFRSGCWNILPLAVARNKGKVSGGDWQGATLKEVQAGLLHQTMAGKQVALCIHPHFPRPAGFTTVKNAAASLAGGQLHRSTRGCSVRLTEGRWTWYDCSDSLQCACIAILHNRSTLACVSAHQAVRLHPRQNHVTSIDRKTKVTLYYCITFCFMVLI